MATITYDGASGGYFMANANIKFLVKPDSSVTNIEELSLPREVADFYFYLYYEDFTTITHNFYLNAIGSFTLTAGSSPSTTVTLTATRQYTDTKGTVHNFTITFTLTDGDSYAKIDFAHTTTIGLNRVDLSVESNAYPQGYANQQSPAVLTNKASMEAGGNVNHTVPAPYYSDDLTVPSGTITASSEQTGKEAARAFDDSWDDSDPNLDSHWQSNSIVPQWIKYEFPVSGEPISKVRINPRMYLGNASIRQFEILGSTDDVVWVSLYSAEFPNESGWHEFEFSNTALYKYIKIDITSTWNANPALREVEMMEDDPNDKIFVFGSAGDITKDSILQENDPLIDSYIVCYSLDASVGYFSRYVDLLKMKVKIANWGAVERQYIWLDLVPRVNTKRDYVTELYFGAWADGSSASIISAYNALDKVMPVTRTFSKQQNLIVRTDLNSFMYEYTERYGDILKNILDVKGNATLVPAGTPLAKFFKQRNKSSYWNMTMKDTQADYVMRSINMADKQGVRLFVEVDVADNLWNAANPGDTAIGPDETTRLRGDDGNYYWVKLTELITSGKGFHDELINHITYLCQNYEFYGLVIAECFYKNADYSSDAKTLFLADNPGYSDWPRDGSGNIDVWDDTLGQWKTEKLGQLWDEIKTIANANNKQFFVMVEPNFADEEGQAREYGQYYPEAIQHCDGLWVWGYYGFFQVNYLELYKIVRQLQILYRSYPTKENIISIGLWGPAGTGGVPITSVELKNGLDALADLSWLGIGDGIEVTPTNSGTLEYMTTDYWLVLWGVKNSLCKENSSEFRNRYL